LGCGDGSFSSTFPGHVFGLDKELAVLHLARAQGLPVLAADMHSFALARRFDAVFSRNALNWAQDIGKLLQAVALHLKPGGRFVGEFGATSPAALVLQAIGKALAQHGLLDSELARYYPSELEFTAVLERAGFQVVSTGVYTRPAKQAIPIHAWMETAARPWVKNLSKQNKQELFDVAFASLPAYLRKQEGPWFPHHCLLRFHATRLT
jgi:trans-aconitate methyltransferase